MRLLVGVLLLLFALPAYAAEISIATFNAEFLTRPKVHLKFGLPFTLKGSAKAQWDAPGFRDQKFAEAAAAVADVIAGINADVIALTEVGNQQDLDELNAAVAAQGVSYAHTAVCDCTDNTTRQHVAVLSKFPLSGVLQSIPGREGYYEELSRGGGNSGGKRTPPTEPVCCLEDRDESEPNGRPCPNLVGAVVSALSRSK